MCYNILKKAENKMQRKEGLRERERGGEGEEVNSTVEAVV